MKILIVEDDLIALDIAVSLLREMGYSTISHAISIKSATHQLKKEEFDILLLDVHLDDGKGTDLLDQIDSETQVIFMTSDPAYAVKAFEVNAVDYLVKPFTKDRFEKAMSKIEGKNAEKTIIIKADLQYHKILLSSILYVKSNRDYLTMETTNRSFTFFGRIKNLIEKLPSDQFMQCHRSYIINLSQVTAFEHNSVTISGNEIPISTSYKKETSTRLKAS